MHGQFSMKDGYKGRSLPGSDRAGADRLTIIKEYAIRLKNGGQGARQHCRA